MSGPSGSGSLERDLYRLLHHRSARAAWRADRATLHPALATLDADEVERSALLVIRHVRTRRWRGTGSLVDSYPRSIAAWRERRGDPDLVDLIGGYLESAAAAECPAAAPGSASAARAFEDVFGSWLVDVAATVAMDVEVVKHERLAAIGRALVVSPGTFAVPHDFVPLAGAPGGWRAAHGGIAVLVIAGRFVRGPAEVVDRYAADQYAQMRPPGASKSPSPSAST